MLCRSYSLQVGTILTNHFNEIILSNKKRHVMTFVKLRVFWFVIYVNNFVH